MSASAACSFFQVWLIKEIITTRISYQWVVQEVISSSTIINLIRIALTRKYKVKNLEGGLTPYLTLENNEYQLSMLKFESNVVKKLCNLFGGRGGVIKRSRIITAGRSRRANFFLTIPYNHCLD